MAKKLNISHITGSVQVVKNYLTHDDKYLRKRYTVGEMFFKPYESKKEYVYCARRTFMPMLYLGFSFLSPLGVATVPIIYLGIAFVSSIMAGIKSAAGNKESAKVSMDCAKRFLTMACQFVINLVVLPASIFVMMTRGMSTGLKKAGLYDFDKGSNDERAQSISLQPGL